MERLRTAADPLEREAPIRLVRERLRAEGPGELAGTMARPPRTLLRGSDVLAGMSHELRTPLNGMLVLAKLLADNADGNLSAKQVDYAQTIYSAGTHLLSLLDDIVDLARIEAGVVMPNIEDENLSDLCGYFVRGFRQVALDKGLTFDVELAADLPVALRTDGKLLRQILRSLLSNAFKFTRQGGVTLRIAPAERGWRPTAAQSARAAAWVEFSVSDTGIGISESRQRIIFEALEHADGGAARDCGGAGLGLSICRELTRILGGEIRVSSTEGMGSRFILHLPLPAEAAPASANGNGRSDAAGDDAGIAGVARQPYRGPRSRRPDDGVVLVAAGDPQVASLVLGLVRGSGYQGEIATDLGGLANLAAEIKPDAVILVGDLCGSDGWTGFDLLKRDPETRAVPLSMIRAHGHAQKCFQIGGFGAGALAPARPAAPAGVLAGLRAAAGCEIGKLLVADAALSHRADGGAVWHAGCREIAVVGTGAQALDALRRGNFDGMVLGAALLDMGAIDLLKELMAMDLPCDLPVAMLDIASEAAAGAEIGIVKRRNALEDVLAETTLFLHRAVGFHPSARHWIPSSRWQVTLELAGRKALIVDADIRSTYAMIAALERQGMTVLHAETGDEGREALARNPDIDVVVVDAAHAGSDGCAAIGAIRAVDAFKSLPVVAVAARAGAGSREQCLDAGASDTIDKPVNVEQLLALLRVWLVDAR